MIRALYSAASGMKAQELNLDNIANNLANANTVGYKSRRAQFQDLMYQSVVAPGTAAGQQSVNPTGLQLGLGTHAASNEIIFTEGSFTCLLYTSLPFICWLSRCWRSDRPRLYPGLCAWPRCPGPGSWTAPWSGTEPTASRTVCCRRG